HQPDGGRVGRHGRVHGRLSVVKVDIIARAPRVGFAAQGNRALLGNLEAVMKTLIHSVAFAVLVATTASAETWNFDGDPVNAPPPGFSFGRTGKGKPGRWIVQAEKDAPSAGNVLAQLDPDT